MQAWQLVTDQNYFRAVLGTMNDWAKARGISREDVIARFGLTGNGTAPHYEFEALGNKAQFSGLNHKPFNGAPEGAFDSQNLSTETFTYSVVQGLLAALVEKGRR